MRLVAFAAAILLSHSAASAVVIPTRIVSASLGTPINNVTSIVPANMGAPSNNATGWAVFWDWDGPNHYYGQDESDARAKYYSISDSASKALFAGGRMQMWNTACGVPNEGNCGPIKSVIGDAMCFSATPMPVLYPGDQNYFVVAYDASGDHVDILRDAFDAGEAWARTVDAGYSGALISGATGAVLQQRDDCSNAYYRRAIGWFWRTQNSVSNP